MCSRTCARIILVTFNLLFFICGILLLAFGIVGIANPTALTSFLSKIPGVEQSSIIINIPDVVVGSSIFMIVLGSILLVFGFLGCAGAGCQSKPLLFLYWVLLVLVIMAEIALIIVAAVSPSKVETQVKTLMVKSLHDKFTPVIINGNNVMLPSSPVAAAWVELQFEVGCCGANNYTDYQAFEWNNTFFISGTAIKAFVPPSCCTLKSGHAALVNDTSTFTDLSDCLKDTPGTQYYNTEGCYKSITELMVQYSYIPIIIAAIVIFLEVVAMSMAIFLWRTSAEKNLV